MGTNVVVTASENAWLSKWAQWLSKLLNRQSERTKKKLLLLFVLLSLSFYTGVLIRGFSGNAIGVHVPERKPALPYYDTLFHTPLTKQLYEKAY